MKLRRIYIVKSAAPYLNLENLAHFGENQLFKMNTISKRIWHLVAYAGLDTKDNTQYHKIKKTEPSQIQF